MSTAHATNTRPRDLRLVRYTEAFSDPGALMDKPFPAYEGVDPYIFVCYAHDDDQAVYPDLQFLHEHNLNVWYDEGIPGGHVWRAEVVKALQGAERVLYYVSRRSLDSVHCKQEVEFALDQELPIVPVYLDSSELPPELQLPLNRVQALHRRTDIRYRQRLVEALTGRIEGSQPLRKSPWHTKFSRPLLTLAALITLTVGAFWLDNNKPTQREPVEPSSIAMLPLRNIDGSEETAIFANGLVDDVTSRLGRIPGLRVASRRDALTLPPDASSAEVRERLRVRYYLEGSVRITGNLIRVVISLTDAATAAEVDSQNFDRPREDFLAIQDEITQLVVARLRVALPPETRGAGVDSSVSMDGYINYRQGEILLDEPMTRELLDRALAAFRRSLEIDESYAAAHAGICRAYTSGFAVLEEPEYITKAQAACRRALTLNPNLDVVHAALGMLHVETGAYEAAEASFREALDINPQDAEARIRLAQVLAAQGHSEEAEANFREALTLQPGNWRAYTVYGSFLYNRDRYAEAAEMFSEAVALEDDNMRAWSNLGSARMMAGDFAGAEAAFKRSLVLDPQAEAYASLGTLYYYQNKSNAAVAAFRQAVELAPNDHVGWMNLGDALQFSDEPMLAEAAYTQAAERMRELLGINARDIDTRINLAWTEEMLGNTTEAEVLITAVLAAAPDSSYAHHVKGVIELRRGNREAALDSLTRAAARGYPPQLLAADPHLAVLRVERRFKDLILPGGA